LTVAVGVSPVLLSPLHVAIVDDDRSVRRAVARLIAAHALTVKGYTSAREFLDSLNIEVPSCLVLDLQMPEMDGLQLLQHLAGAGYSIPTIILTGIDEPNIRRRCELAGAIAFFPKPVRGNELVRAIQSVMKSGDSKKSLGC
jgi:FixJ family two-component response regulator